MISPRSRERGQGPTCRSEPMRQVEILSVQEVPLVESPHRLERGDPAQQRGRREGLNVGGLGGHTLDVI